MTMTQWIQTTYGRRLPSFFAPAHMPIGVNTMFAILAFCAVAGTIIGRTISRAVGAA